MKRDLKTGGKAAQGLTPLLTAIAFFWLLSCGSEDDQTNSISGESTNSQGGSDDTAGALEGKVVPDETTGSQPSPRPSGNALAIVTLRPLKLLEKAGSSGAVLDLGLALPEVRIPEVVAGLLRDPAKLGIDLNRPIHIFMEGNSDGNATAPGFLCVTAGIDDSSVVNGHIGFFVLLGMNKFSENNLTLCSFPNPSLAFGFNRKHFALVLGMGPEIETKNAIARVSKFFEEDPGQSTAFDEHLANAFDLGLYLRPEGVSLVPGLLSRTGPFDLDSSFTHSTTEVRFELGEIIVDFERFTPNNHTPLAQQSDGNDASLPAAPDETAASMAFAVEGNGSSASSSHFARELLQSIWPGPIEMNEDSATTLSKGQWLASWTGAEQTENGSYVAHFALAGEQATLSEKVSDGDKWLNANFKGQVDCPKAIALLRSIPEPEPWRYDMVEALEKLDRLSWSGNLFDSTLGMSFRDKESNGLAILLSLVRQWQSERDGAELYAAIANGDLEALAIAMESVTPDLFEPETGVSPLHFAAWQGRVRMVRYFIGKRINVDAPDSSGRTALHAACWSGKEETVRALLEQNATVDARNTNEATPAMGTARMGHADILGILLEAGADLNASDKNGHGLVEYASAGGRDAIVQTLKDQNATIRSPLHVAAGTNDLNGLKELLDKGRKVDEPDGWGGTALLFAASGGKTEALAFLLDKGADPSLSDNLGFTLVHAAAVSGNEKVLQRILDLNPEINPRHKQHGSTPLDWAMAGQDDILAEMLRAKGGKTSWELGSR